MREMEMCETVGDLILSAALLMQRLGISRQQLESIRGECFDDSHWAKIIDAALTQPAAKEER